MKQEPLTLEIMRRLDERANQRKFDMKLMEDRRTTLAPIRRRRRRRMDHNNRTQEEMQQDPSLVHAYPLSVTYSHEMGMVRTWHYANEEAKDYGIEVMEGMGWEVSSQPAT